MKTYRRTDLDINITPVVSKSLRKRQSESSRILIAMVGAGGIPRRWEDGDLDAVFAAHARPSYVPCILCPVKKESIA